MTGISDGREIVLRTAVTAGQNNYEPGVNSKNCAHSTLFIAGAEGKLNSARAVGGGRATFDIDAFWPSKALFERIVQLRTEAPDMYQG